MKQIKTECVSCKGTGLHQGIAEPIGTVVVCLNCHGKGWSYLEYEEFTGRKKRLNVNKIAYSRGKRFGTGVGPIQEISAFTYDEFEKRFPKEE